MGWFDDESDEEEATRLPPPQHHLQLHETPPNGKDTAANGVGNDDDDPLETYMKGLQDSMTAATAAQSTSTTAIWKSERLDIANDDDDDDEGDSHNYADAEIRRLFKDSEDEEIEDQNILEASKARVPTGQNIAAAQQAMAVTFHKAGEINRKRMRQEGHDDDDDDEKLPLSKIHVSRQIDILLERVQHTDMKYKPFTKRFTTPSDTQGGHSWRKDNQITCLPGSIDPIYHWNELRDVFGETLMRAMQEQGYVTPTLVQMQAIPVALGGNDALISASTGSGKTLAYLLPIIVHVCDQDRLGGDETGPIALVLVPTRELATQIHRVAQRLLQPVGGKSIAVTGGMGGYKLSQELKAIGGVELVVATPGRFLDVLSKSSSGKKKHKGLSLDRTTLVVLDEADKMLQMGFEQQVREILQNVRPDRQTLLLSATMGRKMEKAAQEWLTAPVRIAVGRTGHATEHVQQHVMVLPNVEKKQDWLLEMLPVLKNIGRSIIFVATRDGCEDLAKLVRKRYESDEIKVETLHGDKHQSERNSALKAFRKGTVSFLIATDVAARGLDVPQVSTVVNFDPAKNLDAHVHRVGRAGRLSKSDQQWQAGTAYTLLLQSNKRDADFAHSLLQAFEREGHEVSPQLDQLANLSRKAGNVDSRRKWEKKGLGFDSTDETR